MGRRPRAYLDAKAVADSKPPPIRRRRPFVRRTLEEIGAFADLTAKAPAGAVCACSPPWRSAGCKLHGVTTPGGPGGADWLRGKR